MIHSMTGFGEAQREQDGHVYHLEIRSVNGRYFKVAVRVPTSPLLAVALPPSSQVMAVRSKAGAGSSSVAV